MPTTTSTKSGNPPSGGGRPPTATGLASPDGWDSDKPLYRKIKATKRPAPPKDQARIGFYYQHTPPPPRDLTLYQYHNVYPSDMNNWK